MREQDTGQREAPEDFFFLQSHLQTTVPTFWH